MGLKWRLYQIQFVLNRRVCMVKERVTWWRFCIFLLNRNKDKALPRPCYQVCKARKLLEKRDLIISELHKEDEELARMEDAKRVWRMAMTHIDNSHVQLSPLLKISILEFNEWCNLELCYSLKSYDLIIRPFEQKDTFHHFLGLFPRKEIFHFEINHFY